MFRFPQHSDPSASATRGERGYSLLELLVVVSIIAIMCSLVLASYGIQHREAMQRMVDQRNAQEIVSIGVCATVAGADFVVPGDKQATVAKLIAGTIGQEGVWKGKIFRLGGMDEQRLPDALAFVKFEADLLLYDPAGGQL